MRVYVDIDNFKAENIQKLDAYAVTWDRRAITVGGDMRVWATDCKDKGDLVCNISKGMTNGEVIQALFPKAEIYVQEWKDFKSIVVWFENAQVSHDFTWGWWNAPYQKGSE